MATYRVNSASVIRTSGIVGASIVSNEPSLGPGRIGLIVEDDPRLKIDVRAMRTVYTVDNKISDRIIIIIEPPGFPISDLIGKRLVPASHDKSCD